MDGKRRHDDRLSAVGFAVAAIVLVIAGVAVTGLLVGRATGSPATVTSNVAVPTQGGQTQGGGTLDPQVAAGAHDFVQFACAQCHGIGGQGGVSPYVPALSSIGSSLTVAQLTDIINHGLGESADPTRPYMPVWHGIVSRHQIGNLVAYIRAGLPAVAGATPPTVPTDQGPAVAGSALYVVYGCINCHGPNGLGGVPNPESPDKSVPPLSGQDFRGEFDTAAKIRAIILSGSVIGKHPIVSMPHWGGILTRPQLDELVAYLRTLS
jgi:mono/diheme cytochrome c family protein